MNEPALSLNGYSLERLQSFCAVAAAGSIVGAAKGDPVRQSLISRQIRELEQFFGAELVRRAGRGIALTDAGHRLAILGRQHLGSVRDFAAAARGTPVRYSITAPNSVSEWLLLPRMGRLLKALPDIDFAIHHSDNHKVPPEVLEGQHDFGVVNQSRLPANCRHAVLGTVTYVLAAHPSLVKDKKRDPLVQLQTIPVALTPDGFLRAELETLMASKKIPLRVRVECVTASHIEKLVSHGICAGALPAYATEQMKSEGILTWPLPLRPERGPLCLLWNNRSLKLRPSGEEVRRLLLEVLSFGGTLAPPLAVRPAKAKR